MNRSKCHLVANLCGPKEPCDSLSVCWGCTFVPLININISSCLQALTKDISTPADIASSALETIIFYCFMGYISALTYYLSLSEYDCMICAHHDVALYQITLATCISLDDKTQ